MDGDPWFLGGTVDAESFPHGLSCMVCGNEIPDGDHYADIPITDDLNELWCADCATTRAIANLT